MPKYLSYTRRGLRMAVKEMEKIAPRSEPESCFLQLVGVFYKVYS